MVLFFSSTFPWACEKKKKLRILWEIWANNPQKGSPALTYIFVNIPRGTTKIAKIQEHM